MRRGIFSCVLMLLLAWPCAAGAEVLEFTRIIQADFEFSLLGGTVLNPGPTIDFTPFRAVGELTFRLDPALNDPSMPTTVDFLGVTGVLQGVSPGPFLPYTISPNVEFLGGVLTDIVRDSAGEVTSARIEDLLMRWELVGTPLNATIFTKVGLPFNGTTSGLPFSLGTTLEGAEEFEGFLDDAAGLNPLVALGRNRFLTVVPEPASAASTALGLLALGLAAARRRRATA